MKGLFNITVIAEWVTLLVAIITLGRTRSQWRWFIPFLILTICTETLGWYLREISHNTYRRLPFSILLIIRICFYLWVLFGSTLLRRFRKFLNPAYFVFLSFSIINLVFFQDLKEYTYNTEALGDILVVITIGLFYHELLMEKQSRKLLSYHYFLFSGGLLLNSLGSIVLYIFMKQIIAYGHNLGGNINTVLSIILYGFLIFAFICQRRLNLSLE